MNNSNNGIKYENNSRKKVISEYFSRESPKWGKLYDEKSISWNSFHRSELVKRKNIILGIVEKHIKKNYLDRKHFNILDIGCGAGELMLEIIKKGESVCGIDNSEGMINTAKFRLSEYNVGKYTLILSDAEHLPLKNKKFDIIICSGVLEYIFNQQKALLEISQILNNEGILIVSLPNIIKLKSLLDPYFYIVRLPKYIIQKVQNNSTKEINLESYDPLLDDSFCNHRYKIWKINKLFKPYHLYKKSMQSIGFGPLTFWRKNVLPNSISIRISNLMEFISRKIYILNNISNGWVVCLQKTKHDN
jgi:ubiquinone/menaquinone biosynthesis C-methylase UbiE